MKLIFKIIAIICLAIFGSVILSNNSTLAASAGSCIGTYGSSGSYNSMINAGGERPVAPSWLKNLVGSTLGSRSQCTMGFAWADDSFTTAYLGAFVNSPNGYIYSSNGAQSVSVTVTGWDSGFNFPGTRSANFDFIGAGESKAGSVSMSFNYATLPVGTSTRCFYYDLVAYYNGERHADTGGSTCYSWTVSPPPPPPPSSGTISIYKYGSDDSQVDACLYFFFTNLGCTGSSHSRTFNNLGLPAGGFNYSVKTTPTSGWKVDKIHVNWPSASPPDQYDGNFNPVPLTSGLTNVDVYYSRAQGNIQITKYGPNGVGNFANGRFNMSVQSDSSICTGPTGSSKNALVNAGTYYVLKGGDSCAGKGSTNPDADGWYIDHAQKGTPGGTVVNPDGFGRYAFGVTSGGQTWADVYLEKYAATCGNTNIISVNGSTTEPKAGEKFAMTFGMNNPSGITNWTWPTTKLHVKVPAGVTPVDNLGGFTTGSFDWRPATRDLYVAPPAYSKINSGQSTASGYPYTYRVFFQYDANVAPGNLQYTYNMVFPDNSAAWLRYSIYGDTTLIKNCPGTSEVFRPKYYPWVQTQKGDVTSLGAILGQEVGALSNPTAFEGGRHGNVGNKNTPFTGGPDPLSTNQNPESYFVVAQGSNDGGATNDFCSAHLYTLSSSQNINKESCGLENNYPMSGVNFEDLKSTLKSTWDQNGAGNNVTCTPYRTRELGENGLSSVLTGNVSLGCSNGGIQFKNGAYNLAAFFASEINVSGRGTLWVKGPLTISSDIKYTYPAGPIEPRSLPNFAIFVEGDVVINQNVNQIDAMIVATGKITTCAQEAGGVQTCKNRLRVNGLVASGDKISFARRWYDKNNPNVNSAENIVLTGQSIILPPPGLDRRDAPNASSLQINSGELAPRLN